MGLESATYINDLTESNPISTDPRGQGDDHLRLIKQVLKTTFPSASRAWRQPSVPAITVGDLTVVAPTDENKVFLVDASSTNRTVNFPTTSLFGAFSFVVMKSDDSVNTVTLSAAALINGSSTITLYRQYELVLVWYSSEDSTWYAEQHTLPLLPPPTAETSSFSLDATMHGKLIRITPAAALTVTAPSTLPAGFTCFLVKTNSSAFNITVSAAALVNGQASQVFSTQYVVVKLVWDGSTWWSSITVDTSGYSSPQGRLSLTTAVPVTTADVSSATVVYYMTYKGGDIVPVYNTTLASFVNRRITSGEMSLTLSGTFHLADTNYDVWFAVDPADGVTPIIGTGPAWASATSRGTGAGTTQYSLQNGIPVNTVAITLRNGATTYSVAAGEATLLGSFRTTSTIGQTEDSVTKRYLSNLFNTVERNMKVTESTNNWVGLGSTLQYVNSSSANSVKYLDCFGDRHLWAQNIAIGSHNTNVARISAAIGIDSTTVNSATGGGMAGTSGGIGIGTYQGTPGLGWHEVNALESDSNPAGSLQYYGDDGSTIIQQGLQARIAA